MLITISVAFAVTESITTFTDGSTGQIIFNTTGNFTKYVRLPRYVEITHINMTLNPIANYSWYYKENNDSHWLYDDGGGVDLTNFSDGDWSTKLELPVGFYIYVNYTIPTQSTTNINIQIKWGGGTGTYTNISASTCLLSPLQLSYDYDGTLNVRCNKASGWATLNALSGTNDEIFYEDALWIWTRNSSYSSNQVSNLTIQVGDYDNNKEWNITDILSPSNISLNISSTSSALDMGECNCTNCSISGDYCIIPIYFHADGGILNYSNINFAYRYGLESCGTNQTLNLTVYDEEYPSEYRNATVYIVGEYWINESNKTSVNFSFSGHHSYSLCLYPDWLNVYADLYIPYSVVGGFTHRYYLVNVTLSNATTNISLYNFNTTSDISTLNSVIRQIISYNFLPDVYVKLLRYYPGIDTWRIVQMDKSDDFGQTTFHIIEQSVDYKFIFEYNGRTLSTTNPMKFICTPDITGSRICSLTFPLSISTATDTTTFTNDYGYDNETGIITVNFNEASGQPHTVWLTVLQKGTVDTILCNDSTYAASGTLSCNISGYTGTMQVFAYRQTLTLPFIMEWIVVPLATLYEATSAYRGDMIIWSTGLVMTTTIAGALITPPAALLGLLVGLIGVFTLKTIYIPISVFILALIIIFVAIPKAK